MSLQLQERFVLKRNSGVLRLVCFSREATKRVRGNALLGERLNQWLVRLIGFVDMIVEDDHYLEKRVELICEGERKRGWKIPKRFHHSERLRALRAGKLAKFWRRWSPAGQTIARVIPVPSCAIAIFRHQCVHQRLLSFYALLENQI